MHTLTVLPAIFIVSLGMWAAERRLLEDPARHGALLRRIAIVCLSVAVAGGVPLALVHLGLIHADARTVGLISYLHKVSGMFGGPGYVALFGLARAAAVAKCDRRRRPGSRERSPRSAGAPSPDTSSSRWRG